MNGKQVSLSADTLDLLKEKILKSAIEGKLVPQLGKEPEMEQIGDAPEEAPFEIPPKWKWVKLSAIASSNIGLTYKPTDLIDDLGGTPVLRANNIQDGKLNLEGLKRVKGANQLPKNFVHPGDLLMCARNGSKRLVGKCCLIPELKERMMFGAFMAVIRSDFSSYLHIFFSSDAFKKYLGSVNTTTINQITQKNLLNTWVPLPPFEEQKRIVEKVDCLCSRIDVIQKSMDEVYQVGNSLEKQLLQSAVKGQIVPQLDEEAVVTQIGQSPEEPPFEIPRKWKWISLSLLTDAISDGSHNPPKDAGAGIPLLSAKNVVDNAVDFSTANRWVTEEQWALEDKKIHIELNDVLLTIVGTIGRTAIVKTEDKFMLQRSVCVLKPKHELLDSKFLAITLRSPGMLQWMLSRSAGTAQKGIYLKTIKTMPFPLPPLKEQRRIVEKLDKLMLEIQKLK